MDNVYIQVLIQWLFFFVIVSIVVLPALVFRKIAMRNKRRGWMAFLLGFLVGGLALQIARLPLLFFNKDFLDLPKEYGPYLAILVMVGIGHSINFIAIRIYRKKLEGR